MDYTPIVVAGIVSLAPTLLAIANLRATREAKRVAEETHKAVNGMTSERVQAAKAEGQLEERDNRRVRDDQVQARTEERADKAEARQDKIDQK